MKFGIWSNGFRPHTTAATTYEEDLYEIVVADELGFSDAWISEHHGEPVYVGKVDVLPLPELLMCKAAPLTKQIRFGAAVKMLHLMHPVDIALQAAVADNVIGGDRYMFGFGTGFPNSLFSDERGLSYEDRAERTRESLEVVLKCWQSSEPFDWDGRFWKGRNITVLPKPLQQPHMPMTTATLTPQTVELAGRRGYGLIAAGTPERIRARGDAYAQAAHGAGRDRPRENLLVTSFIYVADSVQQAIDELRPAIEFEMQFQRARGLLKIVADGLGMEEERLRFDDLVASGLYIVGDPDTVYTRLERLYQESGGFGTLLLGVGKDWATRERREESMRRFAAEVAPKLQRLPAADEVAGAVEATS